MLKKAVIFDRQHILSGRKVNHAMHDKPEPPVRRLGSGLHISKETRGHPLAGRDEIRLGDLSDERLILFSRGFHPRSYDYVVECCRRAGFEPKVVQRREPQLYSGAATFRMVASGIGVGIVARPMVSGYRQYDVIFKPLRDPAPALELVAAWRRDCPSSNLQSFLEIIRELTPDTGENAAQPEGYSALGAWMPDLEPNPAATPLRSG